jgi:hypothetical protein
MCNDDQMMIEPMLSTKTDMSVFANRDIHDILSKPQDEFYSGLSHEPCRRSFPSTSFLGASSDTLYEALAQRTAGSAVMESFPPFSLPEGLHRPMPPNVGRVKKDGLLGRGNHDIEREKRHDAAIGSLFGLFRYVNRDRPLSFLFLFRL